MYSLQYQVKSGFRSENNVCLISGDDDDDKKIHEENFLQPELWYSEIEATPERNQALKDSALLCNKLADRSKPNRLRRSKNNFLLEREHLATPS